MLWHQQTSHLALWAAVRVVVGFVFVFWVVALKRSSGRFGVALRRHYVAAALSSHVAFFVAVQSWASLASSVGAVESRLSNSDVALVLPVFNRPAYLRQVLSGLEASPLLDSFPTIVSQDGSHDEVRRLVREFAGRHGCVTIARHFRSFFPLFLGAAHPSFGEAGTSDHVFFLVREAFGRSEAVRAVAVLEDDVWPCPDFLPFVRWAARHLLHREHSGVGIVLAHNDASRVKAGEAGNLTYRMARSARFQSRGWIVSRSAWGEIARRWTLFGSWDIHLIERVLPDIGVVKVVGPLLSRTRHVGATGTNYDLSPESWNNTDEARMVTPDRAVTEFAHPVEWRDSVWD